VKQALFLYGGWPGHQPYKVASWARELLAAQDFETEEVQDPFRLEDDLTRYDLIVLGWTQALTTEDLSDAQERSLLNAVSQGVGVAGWHGMAASFRASLQYALLIGGSFLEHPGGEGTPVPYPVHITNHQHPVTAGIADFSAASEQYYMHVDPNNEVLAETIFTGEHISWLDGARMPVAWVRRWGAGRVFFNAIGHTPEDLQAPEVTRLVQQGMRWAAR
jgi:uncharacterized protein